LAEEVGFKVRRGHVANLEVGTEVKIGATKLIAQVDRVINDLNKTSRYIQATQPRCLTISSSRCQFRFYVYGS
jgi:hypothetical protein